MSPMSWYSGSQLTPELASSGVSSGISAPARQLRQQRPRA